MRAIFKLIVSLRVRGRRGVGSGKHHARKSVLLLACVGCMYQSAWCGVLHRRSYLTPRKKSSSSAFSKSATSLADEQGQRQLPHPATKCKTVPLPPSSSKPPGGAGSMIMVPFFHITPKYYCNQPRLLGFGNLIPLLLPPYYCFQHEDYAYSDVARVFRARRLPVLLVATVGLFCD